MGEQCSRMGLYYKCIITNSPLGWEIIGRPRTAALAIVRVLVLKSDLRLDVVDLAVRGSVIVGPNLVFKSSGFFFFKAGVVWREVSCPSFLRSRVIVGGVFRRSLILGPSSSGQILVQTLPMIRGGTAHSSVTRNLSILSVGGVFVICQSLKI